jgi:hypothetical protein
MRGGLAMSVFGRVNAEGLGGRGGELEGTHGLY